MLEGSLFIKGSGDPKLVIERVWLLLRRVQQLGVREIRGDIVLDNTAFAVPEVDPGDFDGEPLRPYNVRPAALLLNFRALAYDFMPDAAAGVARVQVEPALARHAVRSHGAAGGRPLRRLARRAQGQLRARRAPALPAATPLPAANRAGRWPTRSPPPTTPG